MPILDPPDVADPSRAARERHWRATRRLTLALLAAWFAVGSRISVAGLAVGGEIEPHHVVLAVVMLPFLIAGFLLSNPVRRFLDEGPIRQAVLIVAAASALVLLGKSVLG